MNAEKLYIGTYKVVKYFRVSGRRQVLARDLSLNAAKIIVNSYPDSKNHLVGFTKQFSAKKYFV